MTADPRARSIILSYPGGYVEMTRGLAELVFGASNPALETTPTLVRRTVRSHSRTRVIGGPSTSVNAYSYDFDKYPTGCGDPAKGGREIIIDVGAQGRWTARVSGSFTNFANYLGNNTALDQVFFQSKAGTKYGPFALNRN